MSKVPDYVVLLDNTPPRNKIAMGSFIAAKFCGIMAIGVCIVGLQNLTVVLMVLDGLLLGLTVYLCLTEMQRQNAKDVEDESVLKKMMREGTLHFKLKELGIK